MDTLEEFAGIGADERAIHPPASEEDRTVRRDGWRAFLQEVQGSLQDPVKGAVITQLFAQLGQDRQPGQSGGDQFSRAVQNAGNAGRIAEEGINAQTTDARNQNRKDQEVAQEGERIQQVGDIAANREKGLNRRAETAAELNISQDTARTKREERRFKASMARQNRAHQQTIQRLDNQLQNSKISSEERKVLLQQRNDVLTEQLALQRAELGDKTAISLLKISTDMASTIDPDTGDASLDETKQRRIFKMLGDSFGVKNSTLVPGADLGKAQKALGHALAIGKEDKLDAAGIRELLAKVPGLDEATRAATIQLYEEQVVATDPSSGTSIASTDADGGALTKDETKKANTAKNRATPLAINLLKEAEDVTGGTSFGRLPSREDAKQLARKITNLLKNKSLGDEHRTQLEAVLPELKRLSTLETKPDNETDFGSIGG